MEWMVDGVDGRCVTAMGAHPAVFLLLKLSESFAIGEPNLVLPTGGDAHGRVHLGDAQAE